MRGGSGGGSTRPTLRELARRVKRLGERVPVERRAEWAAILAECFAAAEYDAERPAILAAMLGADPRYSFQVDSAEWIAVYYVNWWHRDDLAPGQPLEPPAVVCFTMPRPELPPPPEPLDPLAALDTPPGAV